MTNNVERQLRHSNLRGCPQVIRLSVTLFLHPETGIRKMAPSTHCGFEIQPTKHLVSMLQRQELSMLANKPNYVLLGSAFMAVSRPPDSTCFRSNRNYKSLERNRKGSPQPKCPLLFLIATDDKKSSHGTFKVVSAAHTCTYSCEAQKHMTMFICWFSIPSQAL